MTTPMVATASAGAQPDALASYRNNPQLQRSSSRNTSTCIVLEERITLFSPSLRGATKKGRSSNAIRRMGSLSCGSKGAFQSWTTSLPGRIDKHHDSIYRRHGISLGEQSPNSRLRRIPELRCLATAGKAAEEKVDPALPKGPNEEDSGYMRMAVQLARKAIGHTSPNPMVGCVIVKDGEIVGQGFHPKAGEPHAEVFALREAGEKAKGATAYVSLEPCNHTGRTPPCSQALVRAEVKRVVVGTVDPNPLVGGKGVRTLQEAGIEVVVGVEEALCVATAESFFHRITSRKPFLTLRYSMSLDGVLLGSCEDRAEVGSNSSLLFQEHDAVLITDAHVYDDPSLLSSEPGAKQPLRVVLAKSLVLPLESKVFDTALAPTLIVTNENARLEDVRISRIQNGMSNENILSSKGVDVVIQNEANIDSVLALLYQRGFNSVLLDLRGPDCCRLDKHLGETAIVAQAQKLVVVIQPVIAGGKGDGLGPSIQSELSRLERVSTRIDGGTVVVEGYIPKTDPNA